MTIDINASGRDTEDAIDATDAERIASSPSSRVIRRAPAIGARFPRGTRDLTTETVVQTELREQLVYPRGARFPRRTPQQHAERALVEAPVRRSPHRPVGARFPR